MGHFGHGWNKNKGVIIVLIVFAVVAIGDLLSTLALGSELIKYLEANPVYSYIGIPGIILVNIFYIWFIYYSYNKSTQLTTRFSLINVVLTICLIRIGIIYSNMGVVADPPSIELAMQVTTEMKNQAMIQLASSGLLPLLSGVFSFLLFKLDHKIECKE